MTLAPREQRTLLKMERSLRRDQALARMLHAFTCQCWHGTDPANEELSPWHPVLWRAALLALILASLSFIGLTAALTCVAL